MKDGEKHDVLVLKDLGGKYGCQVNGTKVVGDIVHITNGDRIQFGNVRESIFTLEMDSDLVDHESNSEADNEASNQSEEYLEDQGQDQGQSQGNNADEPVLNGRAAREAEIAKMMASLDETPSFTKYESNDKEKEMSQPVHESKPLPSIATQLKLPITSNITLPAQSNSLPTSIIFDPAGSRLLVGSSDTTLRLYDFNGMDLAARPFKVVTVQDGHSIVKVVTSNTGDRVFVGTTSAQPIVLDRDGHQILEFNKGDMYVTDMAHTDGHVANVTGVDWHPLNRDIAITCSFDGSVRMWNLEKNKTKFHKLCSGKEVYRIKSSMGKRTKVMCVTFAPGGREFACGTSCGSIQIWNSTKVGSRPERVIYDAHGGNAVHSLVYNYDGSKLASRSMDDDCVKVWEARRISRSCQPLAVCEGLHGLYESVNCAFSPDGLTLCAGTCIEPKNQADTYCVLKFFRIDSKNKNSLPILELDVAKGVSIANIAWHNKLNQIAMGLSDGSLRVFYDAKWSTKGAKLPVSKGLRKTDDLTLLLNSRAPQGSAGVLGEIRTPHALPIFQTTVEKSTKRKREKDRQDPIKSRRPDLPGTGIKVSEGTSAGLNFQQTVLTSAIAKNKNIAGKDPRDELFKYNEGKEYTKTLFEGDKRILAEKTVEEEEEEAKKQNK
jgi:WD40 repeat protein